MKYGWPNKFFCWIFVSQACKITYTTNNTTTLVFCVCLCNVIVLTLFWCEGLSRHCVVVSSSRLPDVCLHIFWPIYHFKYRVKTGGISYIISHLCLGEREKTEKENRGWRKREVPVMIFISDDSVYIAYTINLIRHKIMNKYDTHRWVCIGPTCVTQESRLLPWRLCGGMGE